jgi:hypothetical protein
MRSRGWRRVWGGDALDGWEMERMGVSGAGNELETNKELYIYI